MDPEQLNRIGFSMLPSMSGIQINQNTMLVSHFFSTVLTSRFSEGTRTR